MKILMISANRKSVLPVVPYGPAMAGAIAQNAGHDVQLLDLWWEPDYKKAIKQSLENFNPQVVGISIRNTGETITKKQPEAYINYIRNIVGQCKKYSSNIHILFGGYGFSCAPEAFLAHSEADLGIIGEAEMSLPLLLNNLEKNLSVARTPNTIIRNGQGNGNGNGFSYGPRTRMDNLSNLPYPLWDMYDPRYFKLQTAAPPMSVQTKRGCGFQCLDCDVPVIDTHYYRLRPATDVAAEIKEIKRTLNPESIFFTDNIFNDPPEHAEKICKEMERQKVVIPWVGFAVPHRGNKNLFYLMKKTGCVKLVYEIQSASEELIKNWKKDFKPEDIIESTTWCKDVGIGVFIIIQFGGPGETVKTVKETIELCEKLPFSSIKIQIPQSGLKIGSIFDSPWAKKYNNIHGGDFVPGELTKESQELIEKFIQRNSNILPETEEISVGADGAVLTDKHKYTYEYNEYKRSLKNG